jgi:hypothetical protein
MTTMEKAKKYGIDEYSISVFAALGVEEPFSEELINTYKKFKSLKDRLQPGFITPEGYAAIVLIALGAINKPKAGTAKQKEG